MSFGDLSRSGRLQGAWEVGCGCGRVQVPSSKLCCSHILVRPRAPAFIIQGLESRRDSSGGVWGGIPRRWGRKGHDACPS